MEVKKIRQIGASYLILALLFGVLLILTFNYMPKRVSINYSFVSKHFLNYTWLYVIFNFVLSMFIGISLLLLKQKKRTIFVNIVIIMSGVLIIIDIPPIVREIWRLITNGTLAIPWTIILMGIHLMLFIWLLLLGRNREEA